MKKITASPMVYIEGEEMSAVAMRDAGMLIDTLVKPYVDIEAWEYFDFSIEHRKNTKDQVSKDTADAIKKLGVAYKEQTITPNKEQQEALGMKLISPNHLLREALEGYSIDRDTIHPIGVHTGYEKPVLTSRYPLGDGYSIKDAYSKVKGSGTVKVTFTGEDGKETEIATKQIKAGAGDTTLVATLDTPMDGIEDFARHSFSRALEEGVPAHYVDKGTAFRYQQEYFSIVKGVFDKEFKADFVSKGLFESGKEYQSMLSDAATMAAVRWKEGGFMLFGPNYEMDILTDEVSQVQNDPAHVTSVLVGKNGMVFDAGHGTDPGNYKKYKDETQRDSFNPMSQAFGLWNAMVEASKRNKSADAAAMQDYVVNVKAALMKAVGKHLNSPANPMTCKELIDTADGFLQEILEGTKSA